MFDGVATRMPMRDPVSPRPGPIDTHALLPLLRAQAAEAAVQSLAHIVGTNAMATWRWLRTNWGDDDLRDQGHPARVAALDPHSPAWKLGEAQDALATACRRYEAATGGDGLALARTTLRSYNGELVEHALRPVERALRLAAEWASFFDAIEVPPLDAGVLPNSAATAPTPEQWTAGRSAIAEWMLSDPDLDGLSDALGSLLSACKSEGYDGSLPAVSDALAAVRESVSDALARGFDPECLQAVLGCWTAATGGPTINITVG
jgi:hypothetical protein